MAIERTLSIIKPDAIEKHKIGAIIERLEKEGFKIVAMKRLHLTLPEARGFYAVHRERPFFELPPGIGVQVLDDKRPWLFRNFFRPIRALLRRRPSALMHPDDLAYGSTSLWTDLRNAGAEVVDTEVVVDGQFTTSRSPDDLRAFCPAIVEQFAARRVAH